MAIINTPCKSSCAAAPPLSAALSSLGETLFEPLLSELPNLTASRKCNSCPDEDWLKICIWRCLSEQKSGRAFLQTNAANVANLPGVVLYFDSLRSERRLDMTREAADALFNKLTAESVRKDPFAAHSELKDWMIYAGDGHYHEAAEHDPRVIKETTPPKASPPCTSNKSMDRTRAEPLGIKYATGHFFAQDMRTSLIRHLAVADQQERDKEHDMRALKRIGASGLRMGAPKGKKVLIAWDRACIDFRQWFIWKRSGIYFITLEKANMILSRHAKPRSFDSLDRRNVGVVSDDLCESSTGEIVRRVCWVEPVSGETFIFISSEFTLPPGLIAEIYRHRWDIERVFDETKCKLGERKAWASSAVAKEAQALFLCMTHNLMVHFESRIEAETGIHNKTEAKRRMIRAEDKMKIANASGRKVPPMWKSAKQPTQRCVKFIRWLRCWFFKEIPLATSLAALAASFAET